MVQCGAAAGWFAERVRGRGQPLPAGRLVQFDLAADSTAACSCLAAWAAPGAEDAFGAEQVLGANKGWVGAVIQPTIAPSRTQREGSSERRVERTAPDHGAEALLLQAALSHSSWKPARLAKGGLRDGR